MSERTLGRAGAALALAAITLVAALPASGQHGDRLVPAPKGMAVAVEAIATEKGMLIHARTTGFRFAPRKIDGRHVPGEGHIHVYVDGKKVTVMVAPWLFVGGLKHGRHVVRLTLNTNDHATYARHGKPLEAKTTVVAPKKAMEHGS
ncbi:MAG: hypothetical protein RMM28_06795 [Thermoleophilia bacterium]|nr:hypothetical protein [Gaiellaceae bacterium]MDW8338826.1 hypothetical protein [Thermoleophilia bacterium]